MFRKLKSIDFSSFHSDLSTLPLLTFSAGDCESALLQYNAGLASVLNSYAPLISRIFSVRPDNPWDNEKIHYARRNVQRLERRWKTTKLTIDKQIMKSELRNLQGIIKQAKKSFLEDKILEASGKKIPLFKLVDSMLLAKPGLRLLPMNPWLLWMNGSAISSFPRSQQFGRPLMQSPAAGRWRHKDLLLPSQLFQQ